MVQQQMMTKIFARGT